MRILSLHHVSFEGLGSLGPLIRESGHSLQSLSMWQSPDLPDPATLDMVIVMGGPMAVDNLAEHPWLSEEKHFIGKAIKAGKIVLGICLGAQLIADVLGAKVHQALYKEIGWYPVNRNSISTGTVLDTFLPAQFEAFHWHGDSFSLPDKALPIGFSAACENQGFLYTDRVMALQFHLETTALTAGALVENCSDDLADSSPWIQSPSEITGNPGRFDEANRLMENVWHFLTDNSS